MRSETEKGGKEMATGEVVEAADSAEEDEEEDEEDLKAIDPGEGVIVVGDREEAECVSHHTVFKTHSDTK